MLRKIELFCFFFFSSPSPGTSRATDLGSDYQTTAWARPPTRSRGTTLKFAWRARPESSGLLDYPLPPPAIHLAHPTEKPTLLPPEKKNAVTLLTSIYSWPDSFD
jgi:hypothetical protein